MKYTKEDAVQFVEDVENAGYYDIEHYHGRAYYEGPSIEVDGIDELSRLLAAVSVPCRWDNMGHGYVVHPAVSDKGVEE